MLRQFITLGAVMSGYSAGRTLVYGQERAEMPVMCFVPHLVDSSGIFTALGDPSSPRYILRP